MNNLRCKPDAHCPAAHHLRGGHSGRRPLGLVPRRTAKDNPAYYLRFCKSFARMGGTMHYVQCDNVVFLHHLLHQLKSASPSGR